jgi:DNA modification methylase
MSTNGTGTSVFDPALCEVMYLWFSKAGDSIIDPFAGGSVRGIVAVEVGRHYTGVDLRKEQIEANEANAEICTGEKPHWINGDSINIDTLAAGKYDFMFTCPPYGNL